MSNDERRRGPGWDERTKLGVQAEPRRPHGYPVHRVTPATGIPALIERNVSRPVRVPPRLPTPDIVDDEPVTDELPPVDQQFEGDDTGVLQLQLQEAVREGGGVVKPIAKLLARSKRQTEAQVEQAKETIKLADLVREILSMNEQREKDDKDRDLREREARRKGRLTLYVAILGVIVPTLAAVAAIVAALHSAPASSPAPAVISSPVQR